MAIELSAQKVNENGVIPEYTIIPIEGVTFKGSKNTFLHIITPVGPTFSERFDTTLTWADYNGEIWEDGTILTVDTPFILDGDLTVEDKKIILRRYKVKFTGPFEGKFFENNEGKITIESNRNDTQIAIFTMEG